MTVNTILAILMLFLIGFCAIWAAIGGLLRFPKIMSYQRVKAKVLERGVTIMSSASRGFNYMPQIKYSYFVDGTEFTNDCYYHKDMAKTGRAKIKAERIANAFLDEISIYYNPQNPIESYIEPPKKWIYFVLLFVGIIIALIGILVLLYNLYP